jgi:hypothetical protein
MESDDDDDDGSLAPAQVALHRTPFVRAAKETSELFVSKRLDALVYTDITASLCVMAGISGGMLCALLGGGWTFATHKPLASPVAMACFFVGYLLVSVEAPWRLPLSVPGQVKSSQVKSSQAKVCV